MLVASQAQPPTTSLPRPGVDLVSGKQSSLGATASPLLPTVGGSMDRSAAEYSQSGLPSPYPSTVGDTQSEASSVDHATAAAAPYTSQQEVRSNTYPTTATPTSDYSVYPTSARSAGSFPEHLTRSYHPASNHGGSSGDPSITAPSPTYTAHSQYSPYAPPPPDMTHQYPHSAGLYGHQRPDWGNYQSPGISTSHHVFPQAPASAAAQTRPNQVYSFVPIPGAQQHKRPRRRYEEIERMYKCGWNGCEKAYGTLNHLNAHVTMQAHGAKRTPEEFKEIRKEWKARKKEEEAQRKAEEERQRQAATAAQNGQDAQAADGPQPPTTYPGTRTVQLPPIAYQTAQYPAPPSGSIQQPLPEYSGSHVYPSYSPASPYGQPPQQMYNSHNGGPNSH